MLRFAPSPTGDMHIGNLRVAVLNYILSKQLNEPLLIRIEDTDKERNIVGKDQEILNILDLFGIEYSQVVYQSKNLKYHQQIAMQMLISAQAFNCFCDEAKLEKTREEAKNNGKPYRYDGSCENLSDDAVVDNQKPFVVRIKKPEATIAFKDEIRGEFSYEPFDVDSFVLLRTDKTPTYNFACSVDDMLYDISFVIRGEDHLSNTPKQIHIRNTLGYDKVVKYAHLPIILNGETGKKMSKRDDASSVKWLIDEGFLPVAIANYMVSLGYSAPKEIFSLEEAIEWFKIENISKSAARFDIDKLRFINREHIKLFDDMRLSKILGFADADIGKLAKIYLEECSTINELKNKIIPIFTPKISDDEDTIRLKSVLQSADFMETYDEFKNYASIQTGLKGKALFKPLRFVLTGAEHGPNLSDVYPLIKNYLGEIIK